MPPISLHISPGFILRTTPWEFSFKLCLNANSWAARDSTSPTAAMCGLKAPGTALQNYNFHGSSLAA